MPIARTLFTAGVLSATIAGLSSCADSGDAANAASADPSTQRSISDISR